MLIFLKPNNKLLKKNHFEIGNIVPDELVVIANCCVSLQISWTTILETEDHTWL